MKLAKNILVLLSFCGLALVACDDFDYKKSWREENNNHKEILRDQSKKEELYNLGKDSGYELTATIVSNGETTHYKAAMKGDIIYRYYETTTGGGWNYMDCRLINGGTGCTSATYLDDLSMFGSPITRGPEAFKLQFESSTETFYEASKPSFYEEAVYLEDAAIDGRSTHKFRYTSMMTSTTTHIITCYVEEEYGLTVKTIDEYIENEQTLTITETTLSSFKTRDDVVIPQFSTI